MNGRSKPRVIGAIRSPFDITMTLPGSKSIILRQLVISALSRNSTTLMGCTASDDVETMIDCLQRLDVGIERTKDECHVDPTQIDWTSDVELDVRLSGLSLRLLLAFAALRTGATRFVGEDSLALRPQRELIQALQTLDCDVVSSSHTLPITIRGNAKGGSINLDTSTSSQYLTALMVSGPRFEKGLHIKLTGQQTSSSYVEVTINEMQRRGYVPKKANQEYWIPPGEYSERTVHIEGDSSAATYFAALATLHNSRITFSNLGATSRQGDCEFFELCAKIGARLTSTNNTTTIEGTGCLNAASTVNMIRMPDAALTMMAIAPFLPTPTTITGLASLPFKECNRISCPARELRKAGIAVREGSDRIQIEPATPEGSCFETYQDHRMAMSFAVLASKVPHCTIIDPGCVSKTYPSFWSDYDAVCASKA